MKLGTRVSLFFLTAMTIALAGFSLLLYMLVSAYLEDEFDDRLSNALQILTATIEVEPEDVTWYPEEYSVDYEGKSLQLARWVVADENGEIVDRSPELDHELFGKVIIEYGSTSTPRHRDAINLNGWRVRQKRLSAPNPQPLETREHNEYASLVVTVAMSHVDLDRNLARLGVLVCVLPAGILLVAAFSGRRYVDRALAPLHLMAHHANSAAGASFDTRLPVSEANDDLSELGLAFNRLLERLDGAYQRERRFSSDAAHQLRTPLTILRGELDVVSRRERSSDEYRSCLGRLSTIVAEMEQMVESLLLLARADRATPSPITEMLELRDWMVAYVQRWKMHARFGDFRVVDVPSLQFETSPVLISQILDNLLVNAFQYSQPGTPVTLHVASDKRFVYFRVIDQGEGVPEGERETIFAALHRTPEAQLKAPGGAGLGLAVARRLATSLGGTLELHDNSPKRGSTFVLSVPYSTAPLT